MTPGGAESSPTAATTVAIAASARARISLFAFAFAFGVCAFVVRAFVGEGGECV